MQKLIAIVDDEEEMEFIYTLLLEPQIEKGLIQLKFFSDSKEFLDWIDHHTPDLILSDINMPFLDGPQLMEKLRTTGKNIPTYFVSGHEEAEFKKIMHELGVMRFLPKPLDFNFVLGLIERDLGILPYDL